MADEELAFAGVVRQRALLADGSITVRQLVSLCLDRIERLNPTLNAFVSVRAATVLDDADRAQGALDRGDQRPLLGIPFGVKDEHDLAGAVTSFGTGATSQIALRDSSIVRTLRDAGAIPIGKTAMPELGMHPFTESTTWGITRNPWDPAHTPGGSSGGSAAAVAAGLVPFATAGDGGGSLRIPASCCNLFGLKLERGRLAVARETTGALSVDGILTRGVADAALLYDLLVEDEAVSSGEAPPGGDSFLTEALGQRPKRLRIGVAFKLGARARVDGEVRELVLRVATALRELGHDTWVVHVEPGSWIMPFALVGMRALTEESKLLDDPARLEARTRSALRVGAVMNRGLLNWALRRQVAIREKTNRLFDEYDLLLTPTMTLPPAKAGQWQGKGSLTTNRGVARRCPYTPLANFTGIPAANIPAGFTHSGLPVGAQLLAPHGGEPTLVALAAGLEKALVWLDARPTE